MPHIPRTSRRRQTRWQVVLFAAVLCFNRAGMVHGQTPAQGEAADAISSTPTADIWPLRAMEVGGATRLLGGDAGRTVTAVVFLATDCPISNKYTAELNRIATEFQPRGVELFGVIAEPSVTRTAAAAHCERYAVTFPVLFDASFELARQFRPTHTPEAFVLDARGKIVYRGRIDDSFAALGKPQARVTTHDLRDALSDAIDGRSVEPSTTQPVGCLFEALDARGTVPPVTFTRDIAPILWNHCVECHRNGQVAPFALDSYDEAAKRSRQLVEVTQSRYMPPWKAAPSFGHFVGQRRLTALELSLLAKWAEAEAPEGDAADLPPLPNWKGGWQLGEPDLVLEMHEPFSIPADGPNLFRWFAIPVNLSQDQQVAAVEFHPGNPRVVHHCLMFLDSGGAAMRLDARDPGPGYDNFGGPGFIPSGFLGSWGPGATPRFLPEGMARPLPKSATIALQMHYYPVGRAETDQSKIGLYFSRAANPRMVTSIPVLSTDIEIPPGEPRHRVETSFTLPVPATVIGLVPHMHYLGHQMKVTARTPAGEVIPLVWIRDWDFNWQDHYQLAEGIPLPKDSRIDVEAIYDNSADNARNPNSPPALVKYGQRATDEMCLAGVHLALETPSDYGLVAGALLRKYLLPQNGRTPVNPFE